MFSAIRDFARVLAWHAPAMLAWFLGGQLVHTYWIQFAGFIGGSSAIGGMLLMPVALMAQLVSYVAMFLVARDALRHYRALVPAAQTPEESRREFVDALLAAMLPFTAFYAAQGFLRRDMAAYDSEAQAEITNQSWNAWALGVDFDSTGRGTDIGLTPLGIGLLVLAFALRTIWDRVDDRLPRWLTPVGVYLEAVWIYLGATIVVDLLGHITGWIDTRVGAVWLADIAAWFAAHLAIVATVWNVVVNLVGQVITVTAQPLAWLVVAGTIYGRAIAPEKLPVRPRGKRLRLARARYRRLPAGVRRRISELFAPLVSKFAPLGNAVTMMFRAGPLLIAGYVVAYALWQYGAAWFRIGVFQAVGPLDPFGPWQHALPLLAIALAAIVETVRVALTAAGYDSVLGRLEPVRLHGDDEVGVDVRVGHAEQIGAAGVLRDDERDERLEDGLR